MQKWEHMTIGQAWDKKTEKFYWDDNREDQRIAIDRLNELGDEGWELAAIHSPVSRQVSYILKRPRS